MFQEAWVLHRRYFLELSLSAWLWGLTSEQKVALDIMESKLCIFQRENLRTRNRDMTWGF